MAVTKSPFAVLGLDATADADDVRAAYRQLAKECHPDRFPDPEQRKAAQEKMIALNLAYEEALKRAANRKTVASYDQELSQEDAVLLAAKLLRRQSPETALRYLLRARERDGSWYAMQGHILMAMDQYETAHQSFREAVRREPSNIEYRRGALDAAVALKKSRTLMGKLQAFIKRARKK